jgi:hypothetical protein
MSLFPAAFPRKPLHHAAMHDPNAPMSQTLKLALTVGIAAALALIIVAAARRVRPSGVARSLESEDRAFDETEMGVDQDAFDDRIAPGAPL